MVQELINIDYNSNKAIYEQIYDEILKLILSDVLKPDDKLPSVRELALLTKINPNTIQKAYKSLENDNYISTVKGIGNYVKSNEGLKDAHVKKQKEAMKEILISLKNLSLSNEDIKDLINEILSMI
jgi:GntR family transcriptional regulator